MVNYSVSSDSLHVPQDKLHKKGVFDSIRRDFIVAFSQWDFDPLALTNPFSKDKDKCSSSSVHIWQGCEDKVVPMELQRFVSQKLPWVKYHEVTQGGHLLVYDKDTCELILRSLLLGEEEHSHFLYKPCDASAPS
ncbi:uncharacterized protein LOC124921135 [Impatiens glandulifera]|uniref:uncharacterized protein LOC124921135 n=1 Tax=Impatiens glandulifera TaxID=253017 RepID=UPI001FB136FD|nr:uncharacterized protein LOC124921135 [Impatiens glandulifera]